jgi:hypothetical protein
MFVTASALHRKAVGEDSKGIAASGRGGSENDGFSSCEAHHVSISPEEDRSGTTGTLGEVEGGEEVRMP